MAFALRSLAVLAFVASVSSQVVTQKIIPFDQLPACAAQCPDLNGANDGCVPPAVAGGDTNSYTQCVCNSPRLANLPNDPRAVCSGVCTLDSDLQAIQTGFNSLCGRNTNDQQGGQTTSAAPAASSTAAAAGIPAGQQNDNRPWIETHWQWIVFVVVLILAMVGFSILGVWLKKRHRRRVDAQNAIVASTDRFNPTSANPSVTNVAQTQNGEMAQAGVVARGMDSGVAPPRRTFTGRSRTSTMNSAQGPVAWGPHQNMAATRPYDNVPPSPAYGSNTDLPRRSYNNTPVRGYVDDYPGTSNTNIGVALSGPTSPISPVGDHPPSPMRHTDGAGAQRIREMHSQENLPRAGTPGKLRKK